MINAYSHERLAFFSLALLTAVAGIYSYKIISLLLPIMTFIAIWLEGGIKNISLQPSPTLIFLILLLVWIGLSVFWAENQVATLKVFIALTLTFIFSLLFFSCMLQATPDLISKAYTILKFSGFLLILLIVSQICIDTFLGDLISYKGLAPYMNRMKPTGSILGLTAFVSCGFLWTYGNRMLSIFIFFLIFCLVCLTLCQTAIYSIILATIVFGLSYFMPFWTTRIAMIASYTFSLLSPLLYTYIFPSSMTAGSTSLELIIDRSLFHRWLAWEYYSKKFFEKPLLGWGAESSRYIPTEPEITPGYIHLLHPHNNSVQAYAELGLMGGILYSLFFASLFYLVEKHVKDRLSIAVCNATLVFGFVGAEITHNAWRNYWLSLSALIAGLIILLIKVREEQLHASTYHLSQPLAQ